MKGIITIVFLVCGLFIVQNPAFTQNLNIEFADIYIAPETNNSGFFSGFAGGDGGDTSTDQWIDWSIGNSTPFSSTRTNDMIFSASIGSFLNGVNWIETMRITNGGNVGIGTTSPSSKLHITDNEFARIRMTATDPVTDVEMLIDARGDGDNQGQIGTVSNHPLRLFTNDTLRMAISENGNVGIGTTSSIHPLEMASGAHVTSGGAWTNASSRDYKENIRDLTIEEAKEALDELRPTRFNYKVDKGDEYLGFIAEDVPALVATKDRKGLSPMDIIAVLTKIVQEQQREIQEMQELIKEQQETIEVK